ncbi:MAG TPA: AAA family ATPase [Acidimicrobiales bacterium]|nr:AAA family ATPase [Acidimicrobiales bacterium]
MPADPSVISAIEAAVAADQTNVALRSHLAELLAEAGRHAEALGHAARVLQSHPDHPEALRVAATSAAALGRPGASGQADAEARHPSNHPGHDPRHDRHDPRHDPMTDPGAMATGVPDTADELLDQWADSDALTEISVGELSAPGTRLSDVGGMDDVKRRLELSFLAPLRNPELRAQFGKSMRGGLVLWGPPGCGKTFIARALAGELGANFYEVGLSDVLDMWIGSSERNLHAVFDTARRTRPCVLCFDEIDAIGQKRTQLRSGGGAMRGVVNQFLSELDGASTDNDGLFVLAATNHPWDVDPALLRPGRFDRMLLVLPPDPAAREAILRLHLRGKPAEALDLRRVVQATDGLSGADLALICDHATEQAMAASMEAGVVRPIRQSDLLDAVRAVRPSVQPWIETARNFAIYSNEAGAYDELLAYLKRRR